MAGTKRRAGLLHFRWLPAQQRLYLASLLIVLATGSAFGQDDIRFDPDITQSEFDQFTAVVSQAIFADPVEPARAEGLLGFDVGIAVNAVPVSEEAAYWVRSVDSDFTRSGYLMVPRVVVTKGLSAIGISASYAKIPDTDIAILGGAIDVPIIRGSAVTPALTVRGTYSRLDGVDEYELQSLGAEVFLSKGFGPIMPFVAAGMVRHDATGRVVTDEGERLFSMQSEDDTHRVTVGVRLSLLIPKIVIEAVQGEERTYAAKVSLGL